MVRVKKRTLDVISGDFASGGKISYARVVYASQIPGTTIVGKRPREDDDVDNSFSDGIFLTTIYLVGIITLPVYLSEGWKVLTINVTFIVVDTLASFIVILGRTTLNPPRMVPSTYHQKTKFLTPHGMRVVKGHQSVARIFYVHSVRQNALNKGKKTLSI